MVFSINDAIKLSNSYAPINIFIRSAKHFGFFFISEQWMSTSMDNKYECNYFCPLQCLAPTPALV